MKNREGKGPSSTDLLVCFPTRAHLTLMPKSICSPVRPSETGNRHHNNHQNSHRHHHNHNQQSHIKKSIKRTGGTGYSSPLLWSKNKPTTLDISEPTSPKVTCAGQIKVSHKTNKCKNWQSVMEEIEKLHNKKQKKKHSWAETLGLKKEVMQFLTCLRSLRLDFRCFGSIPASDITSDDEEDEEEEEEEEEEPEMDEDNKEASRTVFSKWFMVLQDEQNKDIVNSKLNAKNDEQCAPPANALLLMRCRSAPAKSWLEERAEQQAMEDEDEDEDEKEAEEEEEEEEHEEEEEEEKNEKEKRDLRYLMEEEKIKEKESMKVMKYNSDFARLSTDIAKETWVVGGIKGSLLSRSRSCKR